MKHVWKDTSVIIFVCKMTLLFSLDLSVQNVGACLFSASYLHSSIHVMMCALHEYLTALLYFTSSANAFGAGDTSETICIYVLCPNVGLIVCTQYTLNYGTQRREEFLYSVVWIQLFEHVPSYLHHRHSSRCYYSIQCH